MKHLQFVIFSVLFLYSVLFFGQNQTKKFYYELDYLPDSTQIMNRKKETYILLVDQEKSKFSNFLNYQNDSTIIAYHEYSKIYKPSVYSPPITKLTDIQYYIFNYRNEEQLKVYDKIGIDNFIYSENKTTDWKIEQQNKEIAGFDCQKATIKAFGRKFIAWYAKDIPLNYGPYKFSGLPGLIVELYDDKNQYHFTLQKYSNNDKTGDMSIPYLRTTKLKETEKHPFLKSQKEYAEGKLSRVLNGPFASAITPQRVQEIKNKIKENNNALELK